MRLRAALLALALLVIAGAARAQPLIDGTAVAASGVGTPWGAALTTTTTNDAIILVVAAANNIKVSAVSSPTTTGWGARSEQGIDGTTGHISLWVGRASAALSSETISVTMSSGGVFAAVIFGVKGTFDFTKPCDSDALLPSVHTGTTGAPATGVITTAEAHDYLLFIDSVLGVSFAAANGGFTLIGRGTNFSQVQVDVFALQVSATQSALAVSTSGNVSGPYTTLTDALTADAGGIACVVAGGLSPIPVILRSPLTHP